jgi:predicted ATPase
MGKTRLALEAAARCAQANGFQDGIYFVSLAPLTSPDQILFAIANAINFPFHNEGEPRQQLVQ